MYALGGIGLLAALLSGGGLGRALLLGVLGLGAGYALNKWVLPKVDGWTQAAERFDSIPDDNMRAVALRAAGRSVVDYYLGGNPGKFNSVEDAATAYVATDTVNHAAAQAGSGIRINVNNDSIKATDGQGLVVALDEESGPRNEREREDAARNAGIL